MYNLLFIEKQFDVKDEDTTASMIRTGQGDLHMRAKKKQIKTAFPVAAI